MANRKETEAFIIKYINEIAPGGFNKDLYVSYFQSLSDKEFEAYISDLESGAKFLTIQAPNFGKTKLTIENNIRVAKQVGLEFFQKLWIGPKKDLPAYLTPIKYLVIDLPVRRASQMLFKKISVAEHNRSKDSFTGQVAGDSKTSKLSYPEVQLCASMDLDNCVLELIKFRGGDIAGGNAFDAQCRKQGTASLNTLKDMADGVKSTKTLRTFLYCMHLQNNL